MDSIRLKRFWRNQMLVVTVISLVVHQCIGSPLNFYNPSLAHCKYNQFIVGIKTKDLLTATNLYFIEKTFENYVVQHNLT